MHTAKQWLWGIWIIGWLPLSFAFPSHPHFPSALLAPVMGFLTLWSWPPFSSPEWKELFLPWLVFWAGAIVTLWMSGAFRRSRRS
jgi:hypothetical protein